MKRALFFLLALAVCLSACTSAPESEAGGEVMDATVENAVPAEESASSAAPVAGGAIWGDNCQADSGHAWYTVNPVGDENGVRQVQLLRLDYNTGKQDCLCTIDASPQQVGEPLARDGMVYLVLDQTLYRISEEDGQMETVPLERPVFPMIADGTYGYDYTFDAGANNIQLSRLDLQTGEITLLSMPAQTQGIWAVGRTPASGLQSGYRCTSAQRGTGRTVRRSYPECRLCLQLVRPRHRRNGETAGGTLLWG